MLSIFVFLQGSKFFISPKMNSSMMMKSMPSPTIMASRERPSIRHPRAAHNLLGYSPNTQSFKPRTSIHLWAEGKWPAWKVMYKLFKNLGIVNARLFRDDARQAALCEMGELSSSGGKKKKRGKWTPCPAIVVLGQFVRPTRRRLLLEEQEEDTPAAKEVTINFPHVAQPIVSRNPGTFVGVPED